MYQQFQESNRFYISEALIFKHISIQCQRFLTFVFVRERLMVLKDLGLNRCTFQSCSATIKKCKQMLSQQSATKTIFCLYEININILMLYISFIAVIPAYYARFKKQNIVNKYLVLLLLSFRFSKCHNQLKCQPYQ